MFINKKGGESTEKKGGGGGVARDGDMFAILTTSRQTAVQEHRRI